MLQTMPKLGVVSAKAGAWCQREVFRSENPSRSVVSTSNRSCYATEHTESYTQTSIQLTEAKRHATTGLVASAELTAE
jgi:hypothetical protein